MLLSAYEPFAGMCGDLRCACAGRIEEGFTAVTEPDEVIYDEEDHDLGRIIGDISPPSPAALAEKLVHVHEVSRQALREVNANMDSPEHVPDIKVSVSCGNAELARPNNNIIIHAIRDQKATLEI